MKMHVLITGAAGFIGYHIAARLLADGHKVLGIGNLNDYYDTGLKKARLANLENHPQKSSFAFAKVDLADGGELERLFAEHDIDHVVNLAAQAGVRYSLINPGSYIQANLVGFGNLLECCRKAKIRHLVFASSSSVYGLNGERPYSVHHNVDHPASLYAASKKSNELMAHVYSHLYSLPCTGLRFFTVYGPWGRPDMALYLFTNAILAGRPIKVFNHGQMQRDFTYIDDITEGLARIIPVAAKPNSAFDPAAPDPASSSAPWRIYNIGNHDTVALGDFIGILEKALGKKAIREYLPMQPGDVESTWADVVDLKNDFDFNPHTPLETGIERYVAWYRKYYGIPAE